MINSVTKKQLIKFIFVGGINTAFGYGIFALLLYIGLHYTLAALFGQIMGVIFNFFTTGRFVFDNKKINKLPAFVTVYGITYLLNILGLKLFLLINVNNYIGGAILILPIAIISFVLNKSFVFNK